MDTTLPSLPVAPIDPSTVKATKKEYVSPSVTSETSFPEVPAKDLLTAQKDARDQASETQDSEVKPNVYSDYLIKPEGEDKNLSYLERQITVGMNVLMDTGNNLGLDLTTYDGQRAFLLYKTGQDYSEFKAPYEEGYNPEKDLFGALRDVGKIDQVSDKILELRDKEISVDDKLTSLEWLSNVKDSESLTKAYDTFPEEYRPAVSKSTRLPVLLALDGMNKLERVTKSVEAKEGVAVPDEIILVDQGAKIYNNLEGDLAKAMFAYMFTKNYGVDRTWATEAYIEAGKGILSTGEAMMDDSEATRKHIATRDNFLRALTSKTAPEQGSFKSVLKATTQSLALAVPAIVTGMATGGVIPAATMGIGVYGGGTSEQMYIGGHGAFTSAIGGSILGFGEGVFDVVPVGLATKGYKALSKGLAKTPAKGIMKQLASYSAKPFARFALPAVGGALTEYASEGVSSAVQYGYEEAASAITGQGENTVDFSDLLTTEAIGSSLLMGLVTGGLGGLSSNVRSYQTAIAQMLDVPLEEILELSPEQVKEKIETKVRIMEGAGEKLDPSSVDKWVTLVRMTNAETLRQAANLPDGILTGTPEEQVKKLGDYINLNSDTSLSNLALAIRSKSFEKYAVSQGLDVQTVANEIVMNETVKQARLENAIATGDENIQALSKVMPSEDLANLVEVTAINEGATLKILEGKFDMETYIEELSEARLKEDFRNKVRTPNGVAQLVAKVLPKFDASVDYDALFEAGDNAKMTPLFEAIGGLARQSAKEGMLAEIPDDLVSLSQFVDSVNLSAFKTAELGFSVKALRDNGQLPKELEDYIIPKASMLGKVQAGISGMASAGVKLDYATAQRVVKDLNNLLKIEYLPSKSRTKISKMSSVAEQLSKKLENAPEELREVLSGYAKTAVKIANALEVIKSDEADFNTQELEQELAHLSSEAERTLVEYKKIVDTFEESSAKAGLSDSSYDRYKELESTVRTIEELESMKLDVKLPKTEKKATKVEQIRHAREVTRQAQDMVDKLNLEVEVIVKEGLDKYRSLVEQNAPREVFHLIENAVNDKVANILSNVNKLRKAVNSLTPADSNAAPIAYQEITRKLSDLSAQCKIARVEVESTMRQEKYVTLASLDNVRRDEYIDMIKKDAKARYKIAKDYLNKRLEVIKQTFRDRLKAFKEKASGRANRKETFKSLEAYEKYRAKRDEIKAFIESREEVGVAEGDPVATAVAGALNRPEAWVDYVLDNMSLIDMEVQDTLRKILIGKSSFVREAKLQKDESLDVLLVEYRKWRIFRSIKSSLGIRYSPTSRAIENLVSSAKPEDVLVLALIAEQGGEQAMRDLVWAIKSTETDKLRQSIGLVLSDPNAALDKGATASGFEEDSIKEVFKILRGFRKQDYREKERTSERLEEAEETRKYVRDTIGSVSPEEAVNAVRTLEVFLETHGEFLDLESLSTRELIAIRRNLIREFDGLAGTTKLAKEERELRYLTIDAIMELSGVDMTKVTPETNRALQKFLNKTDYKADAIQSTLLGAVSPQQALTSAIEELKAKGFKKPVELLQKFQDAFNSQSKQEGTLKVRTAKIVTKLAETCAKIDGVTPAEFYQSLYKTNIEAQGVKVQAGKAMNILAFARSESGFKRLMNAKWSQAELDSMAEQLTAGQMQFIDSALNVYSVESIRINDETDGTRWQYRIGEGAVVNYNPLKGALDYKGKEPQEDAGAHGTKLTDVGFLLARKRETLVPLKSAKEMPNMLNSMMDHLHEVDDFIASKDLRIIVMSLQGTDVYDGFLRSVFRTKDATEAFKNGIKFIVDRNVTSDSSHTAIKATIKNVSYFGYLAASASTILKSLASFVNPIIGSVAKGFTVKELTAASIEVMKDIKVLKKISEIPMYKARMPEWQVKLTDAASQLDDNEKLHPKLSKFGFIMGQGIPFADKIAQIPGLAIVYRAAEAKGLDPIDTVAEVITLASQPDTAASKCPWLRDPNGFAQLMNLYTSEPIKNLGLMTSIANNKALSGAMLAGKLSTVLFATMLANWTVNMASQALFGINDDKDADNFLTDFLLPFILSPFTGMPLIGDVVSALLGMKPMSPITQIGQTVDLKNMTVKSLSDEIDTSDLYKSPEQVAQGVFTNMRLIGLVTSFGLSLANIKFKGVKPAALVALNLSAMLTPLSQSQRLLNNLGLRSDREEHRKLMLDLQKRINNAYHDALSNWVLQFITNPFNIYGR